MSYLSLWKGISYNSTCEQGLSNGCLEATSQFPVLEAGRVALSSHWQTETGLSQHSNVSEGLERAQNVFAHWYD